MADAVADYLAGRPELLAHYAAPPARLFDAAPEGGAWAPGLPEALREYQQWLGNAPDFTGDEAVIITGQQPALFAGPLYTLYKAATAILLARELRRTFDCPVAPVFWLGADDHDFDEARTAWLVDRGHGVRAFTYAPEAPVAGLPLHRVPLEDSLHGLIDEAAAAAPGSEFREEVAAFLHESLDASASLSEWSARILARAFHDTELILFTPQIQAARNAAKPVFAREIAEPLESTRRLNAAGAALEALGYPPQVVKDEVACNFFLDMGGRRRRVTFEAGRFHIPEESIHCAPEELRAMLDAAPERFTPNVALRPVVQQALFPVAAYVAGPGEVAYWGQLKEVFEFFEQPMPIVQPRARAVLTTLKLEKLLAKHGLKVADLDAPLEELVDAALRKAAATPAVQTLARHRHAIDADYAALMDDIAKMRGAPPALARRARRARGQAGAEFDRMARLLRHADEHRVETARGQLARLQAALSPGRKPQERVLSIVGLLFAHGWEFAPRLLNALDPRELGLQELSP